MICLLLYTVAFPAASVELCLRSELEAGLEDTGILRERLLLDFSDLRLVLFAEVQEPETATIRLGVRTPVFLAGPVSKRGLIRLVENPLGFSAASDVFQEKSGLFLNGDFDPGSRSGLKLALIPGYLELFGFRLQGQPLKIGVLTFFPVNNLLQIEVLGMASQPEEQLGFTEWFSDPPPFPGGLIVSISSRIRLTRLRNKLALSVAASGAERARPGFLMQLHGDLHRTGIGLVGLAAYCDPAFLSPDGEYGDWLIKVGGRLEIGPVGAYSLSCSYEKALPRPDIVPGAYLSFRDLAALKADLVSPLWRGWSLSARIAGRKKVFCSTSGAWTEEADCELSVSLFHDLLALKLEGGLDLEGSTWARLTPALDTGPLELSVSYERVFKPDIEILAAKLDLSVLEWRIYLRARLENPFRWARDFSLTLGWETTTLSGQTKSLPP